MEPGADGQYSLRQVVDSQLSGDSPAEKSLEAHGELLRFKAQLAKLELGKASGNLIEREGAVSFMAGLMRALYHAVHYNVSWPAQSEEVEFALQVAGTEYYTHNGWAREPETFSMNGESTGEPAYPVGSDDL
jgi:hypothetical protein